MSDLRALSARLPWEHEHRGGMCDFPGNDADCVNPAHWVCTKADLETAADELDAILAAPQPQLRHWRTCEDCGGLLVYDKSDVDAALAAPPPPLPQDEH